MLPCDVLLVEDDAQERELVLDALGPGLSIAIAVDGAGALARLATMRPRLVLLDLKMSGANGFDLLASLRTDVALAAIPVVVLTSSYDPRDVARAFALGARDYVVKPIAHRELSERLRATRRHWLATERAAS